MSIISGASVFYFAKSYYSNGSLGSVNIAISEITAAFLDISNILGEEGSF